MGLRETFLEIFNKDQTPSAQEKPETAATSDTPYRAGFAEIYELLTGDNDNARRDAGNKPDVGPDPNGGMK